LPQLQKLFGPASTFDFAALFKALNLNKPVDKVIVTTPSYVKGMWLTCRKLPAPASLPLRALDRQTVYPGLNAILTATPARTLELYFSLRMLMAYSKTMPKAYRDACMVASIVA
jgi:hypothetical protein